MTKPAVYTSLTLLAALLVAGQMLKSQVSTADRHWEYASVTSGQSWGEGRPSQFYATAYTCIASLQGCGSSVTAKVESADIGTAMMKAASTLGDDGWELVNVTSGVSGDRIMYFRRPKNARR